MYSHIGKALLGWTLALSLMSAPAVVHAGTLSFRTPSVSGDTSSDGAVITVALFATVCAVLVILGLKADFENVFTCAEPASTQPALTEVDPETLSEIRRRMDAFGAEPTDARCGDDVAVAMAWHVRF